MAFPIRPCLLCGQQDDHPRIVRAAEDGSEVLYHHDCFVLTHPPGDHDLGIQELHDIVAHSEGKKGDELREYLNSPEHREFKQGLEDAAVARQIASGTVI